jgi:Phage integrase family
MVSPRAWFELVMEEAVKKNPKVKDVTWHIFRHTYISRLVMAGADLRTMQELAVHKDIKMTVRYAHLAPAHSWPQWIGLPSTAKNRKRLNRRKAPIRPAPLLSNSLLRLTVLWSDLGDDSIL